MDYIAQLEAHMEAYAQAAEQSVADHVRAFVAWAKGQAAKEQEALTFLRGLGYTVTKG